jgi:hypothetical protein
LALTSLLAGALAGCAPPPRGSYLELSAPDPSRVDTTKACGGEAAAPTRKSFAAPGQVEIAVSAQRPARKRDEAAWHLSIDVTPPPDAGFRFLADTLHVGGARDDLGERVRPNAVARSTQRLPASAWVQIPRLGPTSEETALRALEERPGADVAEAQLGPAALPGPARRLQVVLPPVQTAGARFEAPVQEVTASADESGPSALRTPEYAATLAQREASCRSETPTLTCGNIPKLDPYSFRYESGPFTYLGRFWSSPDDGQGAVRFALDLQARTAQPWRIAEPVLRITDEATGETRTHALEEMHVSLGYPVALDTHLRGATPSMRINVPLRRSLTRYFIHLPPYVLHGRRHAVEPIELQLRIDGPVEQFNC